LDNKTGDLTDATIEFRPFKGWYAQPDEARHFMDDGDYLGDNYDEAMRSIQFFSGKEAYGYANIVPFKGNI
jgi:hypothetical protein